MSAELASLGAAAFLVGLVHCLCGPDHYLPFVAMSRVGLWSLRKTLLVTLVCGVGHIAGSALLGFIGIAVGLIVFQLEAIVFQLETAEQMRGDLAGWLLTAFGAVYFVWGIFHIIRHRRLQQAGPEREAAGGARATEVDATSQSRKLTPWILFVIFLFGPCEPLIPLLMYPAAKANFWSVVWVTAIFGITTLLSMLTLVAVLYLGTLKIRFQRAHIFGHAAAGATVLACGIAVMVGL